MVTPASEPSTEPLRRPAVGELLERGRARGFVTTRELAAALSVQYRPVGEADFAHSNQVAVLDAEGRVVHRQEGLGVAPTETVEVLRGLL